MTPDGDGGVALTLYLYREAIDVWPKDGAELKKFNVGGTEFTKAKMLQFNLLLTGVPDSRGIIKGKAVGVLRKNRRSKGLTLSWHR